MYIPLTYYTDVPTINCKPARPLCAVRSESCGTVKRCTDEEEETGYWEKTHLWVLFDWDQHPLFQLDVLDCEKVQVCFSPFFLGLSFLDSLDFYKKGRTGLVVFSHTFQAQVVTNPFNSSRERLRYFTTEWYKVTHDKPMASETSSYQTSSPPHPPTS